MSRTAKSKWITKNPLGKLGERLGAKIADVLKLGDKKPTPPKPRGKAVRNIRTGPVIPSSPKGAVQRKGQKTERMIDDMYRQEKKR